MPQRNDVEIYKGETVDLPFAMDPEEDIDGWTIVFTLKARADEASALLTANGEAVDAAAGTFKIPLTHDETVLLDAGVYAYDVQRTDTGSEYPLSIGKFTVKQDVLYP